MWGSGRDVSEIRRFLLISTLIAAIGAIGVAIVLVRGSRQAPSQGDEINEVRQAILLSDQLQIDAVRDLHTDQLSNVYADQALKESIADVEELKRKGQYWVSELKGIDFQKVEFESGGRARVETVERWASTLYRVNGRKLGYEDPHEIPQVNSLEKRGGRWYIVRIEFLPASKAVWHAEPPQLTEQQAMAAVTSRGMAKSAQLYLSALGSKGISATYDGEGGWSVKAGPFSWRVDDSSSEAEPVDSTTSSFEQGAIRGPGSSIIN